MIIFDVINGLPEGYVMGCSRIVSDVSSNVCDVITLDAITRYDVRVIDMQMLK